MRYATWLMLVSLVGLVGCAGARHVQFDQGQGVVAIPANTNSWPNHYRDQAEKLMRERCPNGYEIIREEEVVTGQVKHTDTHTETKPPPKLALGGTGKDGKSASPFAGVEIPLGKTKEDKDEVVQTTDVREWRIYYKAK